MKKTRKAFKGYAWIGIFILTTFFVKPLNAQLIIDQTWTPTQIVHSLFNDMGSISNVVFSGSAGMYATFTNGASTNLGIEGGLILSTGDCSEIPYPVSFSQSNNMGGLGDLDLNMLASNTSHDACVIEFDIVPSVDTLRLRYVFGSEEYPEYVCSQYNDVFGFFLSGPGISGPYSLGAINIALIPDTTLPVGINSINQGNLDLAFPAGDCVSTAYDSLFVYNQSIGGSSICYDGFTKVLTAWAEVTPSMVYHIKLAIADVIDGSYDSGIFIEKTLLISSGVSSTVTCGDSTSLNLNVSYMGSGSLTYTWSPSNGLNATDIQNPKAAPLSTTTYHVTVTDGTHSANDSVSVVVQPLIANAGSDKALICGGSTQLDSVISNSIAADFLTYAWYPTSGLNQTDIPNPISSITVPQIYSVTITAPNGCLATDSVDLSITPPDAHDICYVDFDTTSSKNKIIWSLNFPNNVDSIRIYKETSLNVWTKIGSVSKAMDNFIDMSSAPATQSYSYKISLVDSCGNESAMPSSHTTMTLLSTYDQGTSTYGFTWSAYHGLTVADYHVYGIANSGIATQIASVPGNIFMYNYINPNPDFVKYFVGFYTPTCSGSKTDYIVRSNYVAPTTGMEEASVQTLTIYPNPATNQITISGIESGGTLRLYDLTGKLLLERENSDNTLELRGIAAGSYVLEVRTESGVLYGRVVVE